MISLILPYWDRQEAANKAIKSLEIYKDLDLQIVIVDDGNKVAFKTPETPLNIKVITLPRKDKPLSPVTPWNEGVKACDGDIIILSCIEIIHEEPIIEKMRAELESIGKHGYVLAAAWCPEQNAWHCHSTVKVPRNPWGTGLSFFGMMYKEQYYRAGGFNEAFRDGAGYEDNDFINRMLCSGAEFKIRDDLKVIHPKKGASISWGAGMFDRNEKIFHENWPNNPDKITTFVCVNWGDYCGRGDDYVKRLFTGVRRNMPSHTPFRFICFSDIEKDYGEGITVKLLPKGIKGWWNKLYLFKEGLLSKYERIVFLDLDTVLTGSIKDIIEYNGEFATLRDFYYPERVGPAVMIWNNGFGSDIWRTYEEAGYPTDLPMGDLSWINKHFAETGYKPDILQDLFPKKFVSYKVHCQDGFAKENSVVCFHGKPRPHECDNWVKDFWVEKLLAPLQVNIRHNHASAVESNMRSCIARNLPEINGWGVETPAHVAIVGGGPSLKDTIEELRNWDGCIMATNGAYKYLRKNGIKPDAMVMMDARDANLQFVQNPSRKTTYLMASCVSPLVFDKLKGYKVVVWHAHSEIYQPHKLLIGGGCTVGTRAIMLAYTMGFRNIHLFGMDSCYNTGDHHAYPQKLNDGEKRVKVTIGDKEYDCAIWMAGQIQDFKVALANHGHLFNIEVHGEGALKAVIDEAIKLKTERENGL